MTLYKTFIIMIITTAMIGGCSDSTTNPVDSSMVFEPCEDSPELECSVFEVPLIHGTTDNRRINIDVARLPGTGEGPHEPLLLKLGGPGSGTEALREVVDSVLLDRLRQRYDIIGFDQRGVGDTLQVDCDHLGNAEPSLYPRNQTDIQSHINEAEHLADACSAEFNDQLQWVGSNSVIQDMEVMRALLDAPKLNIIGSSFGTWATALYLQYYPDNSGRIILDAPLPPAGRIDSRLMGSTAAQQSSFEQMLNACGTTLPDCDRATVESAFVARVNNLLDNEDQDTFGAFYNLLLIAMENPTNGDFLAPLLIDYAVGGDPTEMFALIQELGLDEEDDVGDSAGDNANESITLERAVICADDDARPTLESLSSFLNRLNDTSDLFAETQLPLAASCAGWPVALDPVADIQTSNTPASLIIGGNSDALTPLGWAVEMASAIGGVFLQSDHPGHTTLFAHVNECVDTITVDFLLEGTLPPEGAICQ